MTKFLGKILELLEKGEINDKVSGENSGIT